MYNKTRKCTIKPLNVQYNPEMYNITPKCTIKPRNVQYNPGDLKLL